MTRLVLLPEAEAELLDAARYYESRAEGLGLDFLSEIESALDSIASSPMTWPTIEGDLRRRLVRRFPFGILYRVDPEEIVVTAVAHLKRRPGATGGAGRGDRKGRRGWQAARVLDLELGRVPL